MDLIDGLFMDSSQTKWTQAGMGFMLAPLEILGVHVEYYSLESIPWSQEG